MKRKRFCSKQHQPHCVQHVLTSQESMHHPFVAVLKQTFETGSLGGLGLWLRDATLIPLLAERHLKLQ